MTFAEPFLAFPDLFPARQSGEPWGTESAVMRFAGNAYVVHGLSDAQAAAIRARFGKLCAPSAIAQQSAIEIKVFRAATEDFVDDGRVWEFDFDLDYAPTAVSFAGFHFMGRLDWTPRLQAALWTSEDGRLVSHSIFENVLRVVVAYHLLEQGGLLLHSAAVADKAGAQVFFGPSGAGKSTIARLGADTGRAVLSDDINALRMTPESVVVEKLPFAGDFGESPDTIDGSLPVRSLCRLEKGATPAVRTLGRAAAVAALLECAPFVNRNPYRYDDLVGSLEALHVQLPIRVLTFAPDDRFWTLLCLPSP